MRVAYVEMDRADLGHCVKSLEEKMQISRKSDMKSVKISQ